MLARRLLPVVFLIPFLALGAAVASANPQTCEVNVANANASGDSTNRSLAYCIDTLADGDIVTFDDSVTTVTFSEAILFAKSLTVDGEIATGSVVFDGNAVSVFAVSDATKTLSLKNLVIEDAIADPLTASTAEQNAIPDLTFEGGAIRTRGNLSLTDVTLRNNASAYGSAGAAYVGGDLSLAGDVLVTGNSSANSESGGVFYVKGDVTAASGSFTATGNYAGSDGGVFFGEGNLTLFGAVIANNNSAFSDGGFADVAGNMVVNGSLTATSNTATNDFGGFARITGNMSVSGDLIATNNSANFAGGFAAMGGSFTHSGDLLTATSNISNNDDGGFLDVAGAVITSGTLTAESNTAIQDGGFIFTSSTYTHNGTRFVATSNISNNGDGGAIYAASDISITGALTATNNSALISGGFAYSDVGNFTQSGGHVVATSNVSNNDRGGFISAATVNLTGGTFSLNSASVSGGAIHASVSVSFSSAVSENNNTANNDSGGFVFSGGTVTIPSLESSSSLASVSGGSIHADSDVTISGMVSASTSRASNSHGGVISSNGSLFLGSLTADNVSAGIYGGAVYAASNVTVSGEVRLSNISMVSGAIYSSGIVETGSLTASDISASSPGGAVYALGNISINGPIDADRIQSVGGSVLNGMDVTINGANIDDTESTGGTGGAIRVGGNFVSHGDIVMDSVISASSGGIWVLGFATINGDFSCTNSVSTGAFAPCFVAGTDFNVTGKVTARNISQTGFSGTAIDVGNAASFGSLEASDISSGRPGAVVYGSQLTVTGHTELARITNSAPGGAFYIFGTVNLDSVNIDEVSSSSSGGVIYASDDVELASLVSNNTSSSGPGGVIYSAGSITLGTAQVVDSSSTGPGGAFNSSGLTITGDSAFTNTHATGGPGGSIYSSQAILLDDVVFENVSSSSIGGSIASGALVAKSIKATQSHSGEPGGVISASSVDLDLLEVDTSSANFSGGAVYSSGNVRIRAGHIRESSVDAASPGSAITAGDLVLADFEISDSVGGFGTIYAGAAVLDGVTMSANEADYGSAAYVHSGDLVAINSTFHQNLSTGSGMDGGLLSVTGGDIQILNSTFVDNGFSNQTSMYSNDDIYLFGSIFANTEVIFATSTTDVAGNLFGFSLGSALSEYSRDSLSSTELGTREIQSNLEADVVVPTLAISETSLARDFITPEMLTLAAAETGFTTQAQAFIAGLVAQSATDARGLLRNQGNPDAGAHELLSPRPTGGFAAPAPFAGPVVTELVAIDSTSYQLMGNRLDLVESLLVGENEVAAKVDSSEKVSFSVSELPAGSYGLTVVHSAGVLDTQFMIDIADLESQSAEPSFWTKRISDTEIKLYAKNIIGIGKVQLFHNGNEIAWVRAESDADPKLRTANGSSYMVRTRELVSGSNVFEIYVDGERVERRVQGN